MRIPLNALLVLAPGLALLATGMALVSRPAAKAPTGAQSVTATRFATRRAGGVVVALDRIEPVSRVLRLAGPQKISELENTEKSLAAAVDQQVAERNRAQWDVDRLGRLNKAGLCFDPERLALVRRRRNPPSGALRPAALRAVRRGGLSHRALGLRQDHDADPGRWAAFRARGSVRMVGRELNRANEGQPIANPRKCGFIFRSHNLHRSPTALENVRMGLAAQGRRLAPDADARCQQMLATVGLCDHATKRQDRQSGGQRQRVTTGRVLGSEPQLILADDPTAAPDRQTGHEVVALMRQVACQRGIAVPTVTPDNRVFDLADRSLRNGGRTHRRWLAYRRANPRPARRRGTQPGAYRMTPLQDAIALATAAAVGVLLFASSATQAPANAPERNQGAVAEDRSIPPQRLSANARELCRDDVARLCADAAGPQRMRACMTANAQRLTPVCRSALETAGMIQK